VTRLPRALRLLAKLTALAYLAWGLALAAPDGQEQSRLTAAPVERLLKLAALAPLPEPEPAPAPEASKPRSVVASTADVTRGEALLAGERPFPALSASYAAYGSFQQYAASMVRLGARFVVVRSRAVVGSADLRSGRFGKVAALAGFSPRARNYTDEPALRTLARAAQQRYGAGASLRMIVPRRLDAALFGALARAIEAQGSSLADLREIRGRYHPSAAGGIVLATESLVTRAGKVLPFALRIDLSRVMSGGAIG